MFQAFAPLAVFNRFSARWRGSVYDGFGQFLAQRIFGKQCGTGDNGFDFFLQFVRVATAQNILCYKIRRPTGGFTQGNSETNKIFSVHDQFNSARCCRPTLIAYFICQASAIDVLLLKAEAPVAERPLLQLFPKRNGSFLNHQTPRYADNSS
jgi:hypothetical protein